MKNMNDLRMILQQIDRKGYPAYKSIAGSYQFDKYVLTIDHVQGDPFASPSSVHLEISKKNAGFPDECYRSACRQTALEDYCIRQMDRQCEQYNFKAKGSGKSGLMAISHCGPEVLKRSACEITEHAIIVRFHIGLPAFGRTIAASALIQMLFDFLPECVEKSLYWQSLPHKDVLAAVRLAEDQSVLRAFLKKEGLVAFLANGAVLPRKNGVSTSPMKDCVLFQSPASMERTFELPFAGKVTGMAVPKGITLIVGGGYHGKSTLLEALQEGVYNHIAGDGREYVVTDETAVKLRAEEGRAIENVDISLFINNLPNQKDTVHFSTENASGSTSQAAAVAEAMEAGSHLLLIDEDTSATNFMVRDELMQAVIERSQEPITPFLEQMRALYEEADISTILVAGSSGAFFFTADHIIQMDYYRPIDISEKTKKICAQCQSPRIKAEHFAKPSHRRILQPIEVKSHRRSRGSSKGRDGSNERDGRNERGDDVKIKVLGKDGFLLGRSQTDMRYVEQIVDAEQMSGIAAMFRYVVIHLADGSHTIPEIVEELMRLYEKRGWEAFSGSYVACGMASVRRQELFAALNRFRNH